MRFLARFGLGLCGLALIASAVVKADDPAVGPGDAAVPQDAQVAGHHHKGLFGWRHCVECQRAWAKKRSGVDVPPPPSSAMAAAMAGPVVHDHNQGGGCAACQAGTIVSGPVSVVESYPAGHAVMGGPVMAGNYPPGYAVMGGGAGPGMAGLDPTPVGVSRSGQTQWNNPRVAAAPRSGAGSYDPSVMPSSMIPAQTALDNPSNGHPHVLGHLFGVGAISRHRREMREDKQRDAHASISYDPAARPVNEVPASLVYGKGH